MTLLFRLRCHCAEPITVSHYLVAGVVDDDDTDEDTCVSGRGQVL